MVVIHFVFKRRSTDGSTCFENAKLLIQDLRIGETLILRRLAQMRRPHDLLRHHQIVCLRPIYAFLALY